jgi:hypothetical protein
MEGAIVPFNAACCNAEGHADRSFDDVITYQTMQTAKYIPYSLYPIRVVCSVHLILLVSGEECKMRSSFYATGKVRRHAVA